MKGRLFVFGGLAMWTACAGLGNVCDKGACDSPDGSLDSGADVLVEAGCDPKTSNCTDPTKGVFVSPTGSDTNDGSEQNPLKTIGAGLTKAKAVAKSRVYICLGTYAENVDIKDSIDLLSGFSCSDWTYATTNDATIAPPSGFALRVETVTTTVSDLKLVAANATAPGGSSIAVFASSATLTLVRDDIEAGIGMSSTQPAAQADFTPTQAANGDTGKVGTGGSQTPNNCTNGSGNSTGAAGGPPNTTGTAGSNGTPNTYPVNPALWDGLGGSPTGGSCGTGLGHNGSYGPGGSAGAGALKLGTLDATGWSPLAGAGGGTGEVGEGGGGGASLDNAGGGGGGGAGGCGGVGGTAGPGGGASIPLLLFQSNTTLTQTKLVTKNAGDGAKGGTGQKAQGGGAGGIQASGECTGGAGGHGGSGGGGGGGAGGISVGILYVGTAPTIDGASTPAADTLPNVTLGTAGALGAGGDGGAAFKTVIPASNAGTNGTPGPAGAAKAVMQAP